MRRLACILVCLTTTAHAQSADIVPGIWEIQPGLTSASLARSAWIQTGAAGLSFPDGRQAVISYWEAVIATSDGEQQVPPSGVEYQVLRKERRLTVRCVTYFNTNMQETGDICSSPVAPRN